MYGGPFMAHLLIVDDDMFFLKMVRKILEFSGYTVSVATDPAGAIDKLEAEKFDLILTDANMPGGSGYDLVRKIKDNSQTFEIPIAMLTGRRNREDVLKGLECGAIDYIVKPIDPDLFLEKLQSLLAPPKTKDEKEMELIEIPVQASARWEIKFEIVGISEKGLVLNSPIAIAPNSYFVLSSYLFGKIQIDRPHLRVTECTPIPEKPNTYFLRASFVGINPSEQQRIRFWMGKNILVDEKKNAS
jgi:two-component system, chemotaxis family, chemotaxis protein CheY